MGREVKVFGRAQSLRNLGGGGEDGNGMGTGGGGELQGQGGELATSVSVLGLEGGKQKGGRGMRPKQGRGRDPE